MNADYPDRENFTEAIQVIFPKLMYYLNAEENRELTGLEISPAQINALLVLFFNGNLTMGELSSEIYLAESAATRLVSKLVNMNLAKRLDDEKDRRLVRVTLTAYGNQLAKLVLERRSYRFDNLAGQLGAAERKSLLTSLESVLRAFEKLEEEKKRNRF